MTEYAATFDATMSMDLEHGDFEPGRRIPHRLGILDGDEDWAITVWPRPDGLGVGDIDTESYQSATFIQAGGSAEALTVEVKLPDEVTGESRQYTVGRGDGDYRGQPDTPLSFAGHNYALHQAEVLTAEDAAVLFRDYAATGRIPAGWHLREIVWPPA